MNLIPYQKFSCLLPCLLFLFFGIAQSTALDSVLTQLQTSQKQDSVRVRLLLDATERLKHSDPERAFVFVDEAVSISEIIQWQRGRALSYVLKGNLYYVVADNLKALDVWQKALLISEEINDSALQLTLRNNLANIYADLKEYDKALEGYETFLEAAIVSGNIPNQVKALVNIAVVYTDSNKQKEAVSYLERALGLAQEEKNEFFIAAITNNLALAYKGMGAYQKSLELYTSAAEMAKKLSNTYIEASALNSMGKVHILMENYGLAGEKGKEALRLSQDLGAIEWQADAWKVLSTVYENTGTALDALTAYKNHIKFRDSVLNEEKKSEITRKEMQYKMGKQDALAIAAIERQELIKNRYLAGTVIFGISVFVVYFVYKRRRDILTKKTTAEFNAKVAETELKALRSQMNPHFIFNSLNSITDYMAKNDAATADDYIGKFSKLTRSILENSEKKWITLEEDLELSRIYLEIEALRLPNKFSFAIEVDDTIDVENTMVPPMLMQPFIENSIWHGISKKESLGHIQIRVTKEKDMVICILDDNGVGRKKVGHPKAEKSAMGIKITQSRLELLGREKKKKGSIQMFDKEEEGLRVELKLPLELRF